MIITTSFFVIAIAVAIMGLVFSTYSIYKENERHIDDLNFRLRHRIISHNRAKAELAILKTRFETLQTQVQDAGQMPLGAISEDINFAALLGEKKFVEERDQKIEALEQQINTLKNLTIKDLI